MRYFTAANIIMVCIEGNFILPKIYCLLKIPIPNTQFYLLSICLFIHQDGKIRKIKSLLSAWKPLEACAYESWLILQYTKPHFRSALA